MGVLCIDRVEAPQQLRLSLEIGMVVPLHAGATSKALLAFLAPEIQEQVLSQPLAKIAVGTITDPGELRAELASCASSGLGSRAARRPTTAPGAWPRRCSPATAGRSR